MKKIFSILVITCLLTIISPGFALAQSTDQLQLGLSRDFGYGGFGNDIQGLFSMKIKNPPQNLVSVEFFIDTTLVGTDAESPFAVQFNTDSYSLGEHSLHAVGTLIRWEFDRFQHHPVSICCCKRPHSNNPEIRFTNSGIGCNHGDCVFCLTTHILEGKIIRHTLGSTSKIWDWRWGNLP